MVIKEPLDGCEIDVLCLIHGCKDSESGEKYDNEITPEESCIKKPDNALVCQVLICYLYLG